MSPARKLEKRVKLLRQAIKTASPEVVEDFEGRLMMSWIYHDHGIEGGVYTFHELRAAIDNQVVSDTSLIPVFDEIRNYRDAINMVKEIAERPKVTLNLDLLKNLYVTIDPEEGEGKGAPRFRKDMPLHRLYFHEIAQPDKIPLQLKQVFDWLNAADTKKSVHGIRIAARAHYEILHVYPFPKHSGKVARLFMNIMLMHQGYPPAIIHATERQLYYDALRTSVEATTKVVFEALEAAIDSGIKFFQEAAKPGVVSV